MFCTKCGRERPDNAVFCTHCGARFMAAQPTAAVENIPQPAVEPAPPVQPIATAIAAPAMTQKEYFANHCSAVAKKRRTAVKALSITMLAVQGIFCILYSVSLGVLAFAFSQNEFFKGASSLILAPAVIALVFTAGSFLFTILGMKKNSVGFFVGATIFAFFATTLCIVSFIGPLALRWLVLLAVVAIYVVSTVLTGQNNKEFKSHLLNNRT